MKLILRVDAAPGFEDTVEDALLEIDGVLNVVHENEGNFDLAVSLEAENRNGLQDLENEIRHESGVQGLKRVDAPSERLKDRLKPS